VLLVMTPVQTGAYPPPAVPALCDGPNVQLAVVLQLGSSVLLPAMLLETSL
jgi:hypothetical protein